MADKLNSFAPVLPKKPKVLILGSMPGGMSLEKNEYYGNPRNHFWPIMYKLFDHEPIRNYEEKLTFMKRHHIALWDTIRTCYREGSLDGNIVDEIPNDMKSLVERYPTISAIACNGTKAYKTFQKHFYLPEVDVLKMPSTSPIPGRYTKTFDGKLEAWREILKYLV